jgi:glycosyltransferase involved in cell wall biosynthesis
MRVMIDTTYARRAPFSGTAVYVNRLCEALRRGDGVELVEASNPRRRLPAGGGLGSARNLLVDEWWTSIELPRLARRAGADVIHHPLPARGRIAAPAQVVTVHDLSFERLPEDFDPRFRVYAHHAHRSAALAAGAVICPSRTTAAEVGALWGVPEKRIVIARHGPGQEPSAPPTAPEHFLYVGDDEPRKNVGALLAAYRRYRERAEQPLTLVLAGALATDEPGVRVERQPDRARLAGLYAAAAALVHPSRYEGFGLTLLEAMSAGTPVIAVHAPGVSEICGDAARYAPGAPDSLAEAMIEITGNPGIRRDLTERGRRRAAEFSWSQSAQAHVAAYSLALRGP